MESDSEKRHKHKKTEDPNDAGMRMGYHSEKAGPEEPGSGGGMRMGYHSEKTNPPQEESSAGMRMGYHSEKANPSKHSKRLHKKAK